MLCKYQDLNPIPGTQYWSCLPETSARGTKTDGNNARLLWQCSRESLKNYEHSVRRRHLRAKCKRPGFTSRLYPTEAHSSSERPEATSAAQHEAGLWSEFPCQNQPVQYAPSILNLQVVSAHPQLLNSRDESHLQWGRSYVPGHRAGEAQWWWTPATATQGRQTPLLQSRLQKTKAEKQRRAALLPDSSTGVLCTEPSQPRHLLSGPSVVLRTGIPSPHIMGRCKAWRQRRAPPPGALDG